MNYVEFRKILVFQTWGIGDMVLSLPMLKALRENQPNAEITVIVGSSESASIAIGAGVCDRTAIFAPNKEGLLGVVRKFYGFRKQRFNLAIAVF